MKTDGRITEFVRQKTTLTCSPTIDRRGRWVRKEEHMIDKVKIREHIESYKPYISHYTRKNATNRRYLDSEIDITTMFHAFKEKYPYFRACYESYRKVFAEANIGFGPLPQDQCETCLIYEAHIVDESHDLND